MWNDPNRIKDAIYMLIARDTDGNGMANQAQPVSLATQSKVRGLLK